MKKLSTLLACLLAGCASYAQNTPWNTTGNIGIGTTNPQSPLNVKGSVTGLIRLTPASDNGEASIHFSSRALETDNSARWAIGPGVFGTRGNFAIGSTIYGNAVATFLTNGNVGIGTISPKTNLDVNGTLLSSGSSANIDGINLSFLANSGKVLTGWNRTKGGGETDFISNQADGETGGFAFYNYNNNSQEKQLMWIKGDGNVAIGTLDPKGYKLAVAGNIRATEIKVEALPWPDYVFKPSYKLPSLTEVKEYIDKNKHLPDMPSEQEVAKEGISLGEMNRLLVKKMEEMTLYMIEKDNQAQQQQNLNRKLIKKIAQLDHKLAELYNKRK
ncbi:hypothetical protein KHS38_18865 [Mucilaginibacter sp. Bleaf8]|uniref:hypothetical protein n=1 Tax=Mucilaginibacter sp. Bleaf8 TaxID=2834430 RepID=UPI001BCDC575|nr:hypothetical protein [Mucilaginibacter sp. Bleaf8]MBS7566474.1 hypothetical protein [Mucilaginibacter sp. Bleaf8]